MNPKVYNQTEWAEAAVSGILSPKERAAAKQELLDHMEDHAEALRAAGFSPDAAEEQAIAAMGDPEITAKLLRKAHQPVLTRILQVCRYITILLAVVLVLQGFAMLLRQFDLKTYIDPPPPVEEFLSVDSESVDICRVLYPNTKTQVGAYTLEVDWITVGRYYEQDVWWVSIMVEFAGKYPLSEPVFAQSYSYFAAPWVLTDGNRICGREGMDQPCPEGAEYLWVFQQGQVLSHKWFVIEGTFLSEPEQVTLSYLGEDHPLTLTFDLKGGAAYDQVP